MSEAENENRRRIDALRNDFEKSEIKRKVEKEIQEANMKILESNLKELLAKNEVAFQQLRADVHKFMWVGLATGITLVGTIVVLVEYAFRGSGG